MQMQKNACQPTFSPQTSPLFLNQEIFHALIFLDEFVILFIDSQ